MESEKLGDWFAPCSCQELPDSGDFNEYVRLQTAAASIIEQIAKSPGRFTNLQKSERFHLNTPTGAEIGFFDNVTGVKYRINIELNTPGAPQASASRTKRVGPFPGKF